MPTVLELANVSATHVHFGRSLVPQVVHGQPGDPSRAVFAEGGYATNEPRDFEGDASSGGIGRPGEIYYPKLKQQQELNQLFAQEQTEQTEEERDEQVKEQQQLQLQEQQEQE